ncbi:receptor kinase-like protein Xa21 [Bidens hawaiensis]|uniref:receptor kinase-like protein Xa21 n=1 Tax=Bidens hawaiensis TaxID=980011 RepID=UPI00404B5F63
MALLSFKKMIYQDPYGALSSWNSSSHFCDWSGVSCGKRHIRVTRVRLISQGLKGSLSPHVGNLSFLRVFLLTNNSFEGIIPQELGRLFRLRILSLAYNEFSGFIPTNLSGCSNLEELKLLRNMLVGRIPKEISFLSKLTLLSLGNNILTGGISPFLGNITSVEVFSILKNPLGGGIPHELGNLKNLTGLYLGNCNLHGSIPHSIYNLSLLNDLAAVENQLTGSLPQAIGTMLPHLINLQLRNNNLTGRLPPSISNCSKLQLIELGANKFNGKVTINFAKLRDLSKLSLRHNNLYGHDADEMKFIESLYNCSKLLTLALNICNFQGMLPKSIGNLSNQLDTLNLLDNQLYGNLPSSIGNLVGLTTLHIGENRFTGNIPSTIGMLQKLQVVGLYENRFVGPIPDTVGNLSLLTNLYLSSNRLEGHIPISLGNCRHLLLLYLDDNKLSGKIPKQLLQIQSLSITLDLSNNMLSGSLPTEVGELKMLSNLDLSYNNLSGRIPTSLSGCTSISILYLNDNLFQGMIPPSLSSLRGVVELDLSHNKLFGQIPRFLEHFSLEYLNLSFNNFVGEVPVLGVFANASAFSVSGNNRLCGGLVELGLPKCKEPKKHKKWLTILVIVILIAATLFTILWLVCFWCKKSKSQPSQSLTVNERFLKVSYNQLAGATNGFSEANLIGRGGFSSVYKGILDNDDEFVAIKVLHLQIQGAYRSFDAECDAWRSIRHRNLLKIITACSSVDFQGNDFKALVYEYMPNGSLDDWLHSSTRTHRLDLIQRINILIDVACALDYLHNHCQTAIVHGDLKPSNILLDEDMVAHVGDFGLSKFLGMDSDQSNSIKFRGTIGYAPPEYGLRNMMTCSGDVYSFGVLLLEVMIGKRPTDNMFNNGLSLHKFAYLALPNNVMDVIDGDLINYHQDDAIVMQTKTSNAQKIEECMASVVNIGVSCSMDSPPQRMNISDVARHLQKVTATLQNV